MKGLTQIDRDHERTRRHLSAQQVQEKPPSSKNKEKDPPGPTPERVYLKQVFADLSAGLISLGIGFALQGGGYVALIAGATVDTGPARAVLSVAFALVAAGVAFLAFRQVRWRLVKRLAVQVARANPGTSQMDELPDETTLVALGRALGMTVVEVTPSGVVAVGEWAKQAFGVDELGHGMPLTMPAPPAR